MWCKCDSADVMTCAYDLACLNGGSNSVIIPCLCFPLRFLLICPSFPSWQNLFSPFSSEPSMTALKHKQTLSVSSSVLEHRPSLFLWWLSDACRPVSLMWHLPRSLRNHRKQQQQRRVCKMANAALTQITEFA